MGVMEIKVSKVSALDSIALCVWHFNQCHANYHAVRYIVIFSLEKFVFHHTLVHKFHMIPINLPL